MILRAKRPTKRYCSNICKHRAEGARRKERRAGNERERIRLARPDVSVADAAWLAGVIDGEGTVALSHGGDGRIPHLRVAIYNTSDPILTKVRQILHDGDVSFYEKRDHRSGLRPCSHIVVGTEGVLLLYDALRPHLTRQVARLDAAVEFLRPRYDGRRRVHWQDEDLSRWTTLRAEYNQR